MRPKHTPLTAIRDLRPSVQRGFALVSAIFLLLVLAALGTFMVTLSTVQNVTSTQDLQGSRAYHAARSGIEWGAYQILQNTNNCPLSTSLTPPAVSLAGFTVTVECVDSPFVESGDDINVYQLTSTARFGTPGSTNYVERQFSAAIDTCSRAGVACSD